MKGLNKSVKYILERNKKTFKPSFKTTFNFSAYFQTSFLKKNNFKDFFNFAKDKRDIHVHCVFKIVFKYYCNIF